MAGRLRIGATAVSALGSSNPDHGSAAEDQEWQALKAFIRTGRLFDRKTDFDPVTLDPVSGRLRPAFVPGSTIGGSGDGLHSNCAGYTTAAVVDLALLLAASVLPC